MIQIILSIVILGIALMLITGGIELLRRIVGLWDMRGYDKRLAERMRLRASRPPPLPVDESELPSPEHFL